MARASLGTIDPSTTSGTALAALLSARDAAENTGHAGTGRPSYAVAGMLYTDDSFTPDHIFLAGATAPDDVDLTLLFSPRPGTIRETAEVRLPSGWLWADGSAVLRASYPELLEAIAPSFTGSTTNTSTTISSVSEDLRQLGLLGAKIEGSGIQVGTTITAIAATTITLSLAATITAAGVALRVFPQGNGNGSTTFNLPNRKGRAGIGRGDMGGTDVALVTTAISGFDGTLLAAAGGAQSIVLITANLPIHSHSASTSGTTDSPGNHTHGPGTYNTDASGSHTHSYQGRTSPDNSSTGSQDEIPGSDGSGALRTLTSSASGNHAHVIDGGVSAAAGNHTHTLTLSTTIGNTGADTAHRNMPPSVVENFVVKT